MLVTDINALTPIQTTRPTAVTPAGAEHDKEALKTVAKDFETAFIAQMLTHSGLTESLTSGEGKMAAAFGSFYVEQLAERMADDGGFGMADSIYKQLERYGQAGETS